MTDLVAKARLDLDASGYKRGLEEARTAQRAIMTDALRSSVAASKALQEAQDHAQNMARALKADGKAGEDFGRWMQGAAAAVRLAKDQVIAKTEALQRARSVVQENATAIEQAAKAEIASIKSAEAARDAAHRRALENSREEIRARRESAQESAADAAHALKQAWGDREARAQSMALAASGIRNADHGRALAEDQSRTQAALNTQKARDMAALARFNRGQDAERLGSPAAGGTTLRHGGHGEGGEEGSEGGGNNGVRREALVLAHELAMGNTSRFGGSLMVMAERMNISAATLTAIGIPLVAVGAAAFVLAKAYNEGAEQMQHMLQAQAASGGISGASRGQMMGLGQQVANDSTLTVGEGRDLVTQLVGSGKIGQKALKPIAGLADNLGSTLGIDADKLGAEMVKIFADPAKGAKELNDRMHLLTVSELEHIEALHQMGDTEGAQVALAEKAAAAALNHRDSLTGIGRAWNSTKQSASEYWQFLMSLDVKDTPEEAAQTARARIHWRSKLPGNHDEANGKDQEIIDKAKANKKQADEAANEESHTSRQNVVQGQIADMDKATPEYRQRALMTDVNRLRNIGTGDKDLDALQGGALAGKLAELQKVLPNTETAWKDFVKQITVGTGQVRMSAGQTRQALENLLSGAKTPEQWAGVVAGLTQALARAGGKSKELEADLQSAIVRREESQVKALNDTLAGMLEGGKRALSLFDSIAGQANLARGAALGVAKVQAELGKDPVASSKIDAAAATGAVAAARAAADMKLSIIEDERRAKLAKAAEEVASDENLAGHAKELASRKVAIERESALARRAILEDLQRSTDGAAQAALQKYKGYAEEVISTDKAIARNRLDTAASINSLLRQDMDGKGKAQSLRDEMATVQAAAVAAAQNGDRAGALDLLGRKKSLATELAGTKGDGADPVALKAEAIAALKDIGAQSEGLLQEQRAAAVAAAEEQKRVYMDMTKAVQQIGQEIAKLNASLALQVRAQVSAESLQTAIQQIRDALGKETFKINIAAGQVAGGAAAGLSPAAIASAGQAPARAAVAAADQVQASLPVRAVAPVVAASQDSAKVAAKYRQGDGSYGNAGSTLAPGLQPINMALGDGRNVRLYAQPDHAAELGRVLYDSANMVGN